MSKQTLQKPEHHSMAHHLVTYAANNMIAPLTHAQIARDEYETLRRERDEAVELLRPLQKFAADWMAHAPSIQMDSTTVKNASAFLSRIDAANKDGAR